MAAGGQGVRDTGRRGALSVVESPIAARECESVGLTHGWMTDDVDAEVEVGSEPSHDGELLVVLLAEHRRVRSGGGEQFGDHRGDAVEVAWAGGAFHRIGQRRDLHRRGEPVGIHRRHRRHEHDVDARVVAGAKVAVDRPGIVLEIAALAELEWVDEDRHRDGIGELVRSFDELEVASVQRAHGGHQRDRSPRRPGGIRPGAHVGRGVDHGGHDADASAQSGRHRRGAGGSARGGAAPPTARRRSRPRRLRSPMPPARRGCTRVRTCRQRPAGSG